ncbi:MAG: nitrogenase component 1, partial [Candidatus Nezhaarchaeales archaeon]
MNYNRQMTDPVHDCKLLGVIRALTGLKDSAIVVHGRPGCHSGMLSLQALTSSQRFVNVVFSGLKSEDMAFGGEARLFRALLNVSGVMKPKLVAVA